MSETKKTRHSATFTNDKRNGGYLIRVVGPDAKMFAGREVPVTTLGGKTEMHKLTKLKFSGVDDGKYNAANAGQPYAVYAFEPRPFEQNEVEF